MNNTIDEAVSGVSSKIEHIMATRESIRDLFVMTAQNINPVHDNHENVVNRRDFKVPSWEKVTFEEIREACQAICDLSALLQNVQQNVNFDDLLVDQMTTFIHGSNAIEDVHIPLPLTRKLCAVALKGFHGSCPHQNQSLINDLPLPTGNQTCREVVQHVQALLYLFRTLREKSCITEKDLLQCHAILMADMPTSEGETDYQGTYRTCTMTVGKPLYDKDGQFCALAEPDEVSGLMEKWLENYNYHFKPNLDVNAISAAVNLKIRFLVIHPFLDGNGRMSRMLMNALIMYHHPYAMVDFGKTGKERNRYQMTLRKSISLKDGATFAFFTLKTLAKTQRALVEKVEKAEKAVLLGHKDDSVLGMLSEVKNRLDKLIGDKTK